MTASDLHAAAALAAFVGAGGVSVWTLVATLRPNHHRILAALSGRTAPPAASVAPTRQRNPTQLRRVEAATEPTSRVQS